MGSLISMIKKIPDIEIINSIQHGNKEDFRLLVDRYKDRAFSMLKRMLKNEMEAEEVLQDSFIKAFNSIPNFRGDAKFSTWFYKIVYNTCLTVLSNQKRKKDIEFISIDEEFEIGAYDNKIYAQAENGNEYLYKLIDKLPIRYSLIIILFYIDNLSINEISNILDVSIVNVKVILFRARNELKDLMIKHNYQKEYN